jgi:NtrC-family two-component system sensor histidine kinase KinB
MRKRAEKQLKEATATRSQFISVVSHELRTPLTSIKGVLDIVTDESAGPLNAEQKDLLEGAKENMDRLARLISDVLDFQKLEAGKMPFEMKRGDVNLVIEGIHKALSPTASLKNLELHLDLEDGLSEVTFDHDKIIQVLTNLVSNAIEFTSEGCIRIASCRAGEMIQISVADDGQGIMREDLPKLFRKFTQLRDQRERKTGGTGLGLAISREIIEEHRGKIWVESKPGVGSTFSFVLPIEQERDRYGAANPRR